MGVLLSAKLVCRTKCCKQLNHIVFGLPAEFHGASWMSLRSKLVTSTDALVLTHIVLTDFSIGVRVLGECMDKCICDGSTQLSLKFLEASGT